MAAKKMTAKSTSIEDEIRKRYNARKGSLVNSRSSSEPGKTGPVSRKEYVSSFVDVVAESPLSAKRGWESAAKRVAADQWNRTFGPKKSMAGVKAAGVAPAKKTAPKAMPAGMKKKSK